MYQDCFRKTKEVGGLALNFINLNLQGCGDLGEGLGQSSKESHSSSSHIIFFNLQGLTRLPSLKINRFCSSCKHLSDRYHSVATRHLQVLLHSQGTSALILRKIVKIELKAQTKRAYFLLIEVSQFQNQYVKRFFTRGKLPNILFLLFPICGNPNRIPYKIISVSIKKASYHFPVLEIYPRNLIIIRYGDTSRFFYSKFNIFNIL